VQGLVRKRCLTGEPPIKSTIMGRWHGPPIACLSESRVNWRDTQGRIQILHSPFDTQKR